VLSSDTYQCSTDIANEIAKLAVNDIRSNANIEAHDFFKRFENEVERLTGQVYTITTEIKHISAIKHGV
jgi:hypothetical protein